MAKRGPHTAAETTAAAEGRICVLALPGADEQAAEELAQQVGATILCNEDALLPSDFCVRFDQHGTALQRGKMRMQADLASMLPRLKPGRLNQELLVKAAKIKRASTSPANASPAANGGTAASGAASVQPRRPRAVDATAGLGEDALLLAAAGFEVLLYERDPIIAALLADSLRRARADERLAEAASRMRLAGSDSIVALPALGSAPDVVYLDPMFPERRKQAAVKKKFQLIHQLERPCTDEKALVQSALAARPRKIVIKRPLKGPHLAGIKPSYSIAGKSIRYDCLVP